MTRRTPAVLLEQVSTKLRFPVRLMVFLASSLLLTDHERLGSFDFRQNAQIFLQQPYRPPSTSQIRNTMRGLTAEIPVERQMHAVNIEPVSEWSVVPGVHQGVGRLYARDGSISSRAEVDKLFYETSNAKETRKSSALRPYTATRNPHKTLSTVG